MSEFDSRARDWDSNPIHWERSEAIAQNLLKMIPFKTNMKALEYGAGTGILSFLLCDKFSEITLMDNSKEMVQVMHEKVIDTKITHLKPLFFDLEHSDYQGGKFDGVFTQMVLHHVADTSQILNKFYQIIHPEGFLAIADLYSEDGSFHGDGFNGHKGFDVTVLQKLLEKIGFKNVVTTPCYTIKKAVENKLHEFPVFLITALRP